MAIKVKQEVSVDAGQIMVLLQKEPTDHSIVLNPGLYKIKLSVKDSWNGPNFSENYLEVKRNTFLCIADGFYKDKDGEKIVENHQLYKKGCALSTGGDGTFKVLIEIKKVSKIGPDPYKILLSQAKLFFKQNKYNDQNKKRFVNKFLSKVYYSKINEILMDQDIKQMRLLNRNIKKILKKIKTNAK